LLSCKKLGEGLDGVVKKIKINPYFETRNNQPEAAMKEITYKIKQKTSLNIKSKTAGRYPKASSRYRAAGRLVAGCSLNWSRLSNGRGKL